MHCYIIYRLKQFGINLSLFTGIMICYSPEVYSISISLKQFCVDKTLKKPIRVFNTLKTCMPECFFLC